MVDPNSRLTSETILEINDRESPQTSWYDHDDLVVEAEESFRW